MFQETVVQVEPEQVEKAISAGAIAFDALVMAIVMVLLLLVNALRTLKSDFEWMIYLKGNVVRFTVGGVIILGLASLIHLSHDFGQLLSLLGFNVEKTPVALGGAVAVLVMAGISGKVKDDGEVKDV